MDISDNQIVTAIRNGDKESFAVLVERYDTVIYNLMRRYSYSSEDAADMTREVFCRVYEKLGRYRKRTSFFAWLYTLALNYARDCKKKQYLHQRKLARYTEDLKIEASLIQNDVERRQETEVMMQALDGLEENRRELLILRYRHERSIRELSEIFEVSESAIKMRIKRTLGELNNLLGEM
jgi:RNA polymerase sigma-70 factor, ECF subfamily